MKIDLKKLNRKTIKELPNDRKEGEEYDAICIIPSGLKHDSGYMSIAIVGIKNDGNMEVCAYPDDINWDFSELKQNYSNSGMRTDCYYPNGLIRCWGNDIKFIVGDAYPSTDIKVINKTI